MFSCTFLRSPCPLPFTHGMHLPRHVFEWTCTVTKASAIIHDLMRALPFETVGR